MLNGDSSLSFHSLLKSKTSKLHNEIDSLSNINLINSSIENYINYVKVLYKIIAPLEKIFSNYNELSKFFPNTKIHNKSCSLILDLKNLQIDFNDINYSKYIPRINSFEQVLGCFYVIEGSSLGNQYLFKKLSSIHGENLKNKMNYLNGLGKETFHNWNYFIDSLEKYNNLFPEKKNEIIASAIDTFKCFKSEFRSQTLP